MAKIYLSSTFRDLNDHRKAVYQILRELRHDVIAMEDYGAAPERPLEKCLADVRDCDIYVGVFAWRYGFRPPGKKRSITELELEQATSAGKPCLIFILDDSAPWPPNQMDSGEDLQAIKALRTKLATEHVVKFFRTAEELASAVGTAVTTELRGSSEEPGEDSGGDPALCRFCRNGVRTVVEELHSQIRFYAALAAILAVLGLLVFGGGFALKSDENMIVKLFGILIFVATGYPQIRWRSARTQKAFLAGYESELARDQPAEEAVRAVKAYLLRHLQ